MNPTIRVRSQFSVSLDQQLNAYAVAVTAAGVGMLALAQPAEAKIVYKSVHHVIGSDHTYYIDLNNDKIHDFEIKNTRFCGALPPPSAFCQSYLHALPAQPNNGVVGKVDSSQRHLDYKLKLGTKIGSEQPFSGSLMASTGSLGPYGQWHHAHPGYLGLKFQINGKVHYGWARFNVTYTSGSNSVALTGYAYETIPGKAIIAGATKGPDDGESTATLTAPTPEPATLGMLALGAPGLSIWRREEAVVARP